MVHKHFLSHTETGATVNATSHKLGTDVTV